MMSDQLKIGDPVWLKSGGPAMSIRLIGDELSSDNVWCQWFEGEIPNEGCFPKDSLEPVSKPGGASGAFGFQPLGSRT